MANIPPETSQDLSTDADWEAWGKRDPYFGVLTHPRFRRSAMDEQAREDFFLSGRQHAQFVLDISRQFVDPAFKPRSILEFGCGVGRVLVAFAAIAPEVTAVDISPSMLAEARKNCDANGLRNVKLHLADDALTRVDGTFDLVHTFIVLQHVPVERVRVIFNSLLARVAPGGIGAIHFVYSKSHLVDTHGVAPPAPPAPALAPVPVPAAPETPPVDPNIQMNPFHMNEALFAMQRAGVLRFHAEFTDHGGELGAFLFFQKPAQA